MKKIRTNFPLPMWVDVAMIAIPLFAIGIATDHTWAFWATGAALAIGIIGALLSLYHYWTDKPIKDSPVCKDISMAATYVWPCILSGLIVDYFGIDGLLFYLLAVAAMGIILLINHFDLV